MTGPIDAYGASATAYPAALGGTRAPLMLAYLPPYHHSAPHTRQLMQAMGYEMDYLRGQADAVATYLNLTDCEAWVLQVWEVMLGLPDRASWTESQRRSALAWFSPAVVLRSAASIIAFVSDQTLIAEARLDLTEVGDWDFEYDVDTPTGTELADAGAWFRRAVPAHIALAPA